MSFENEFWDLYDSNPKTGKELEELIYELGYEFVEEEDGFMHIGDMENYEEAYEEVLEVYQQRNGALLDLEKVEEFLYTAFHSSDAFKRVDYLHSVGNDRKGIRVRTGGRTFNIYVEEV